MKKDPERFESLEGNNEDKKREDRESSQSKTRKQHNSKGNLPDIRHRSSKMEVTKKREIAGSYKFRRPKSERSEGREANGDLGG